MTATEILTQIATFKKGVPFTLCDLKTKFPNEGGKIFTIGVMWGKIEPNWQYKPIGNAANLTAYLPHGAVATTPYFVFV